MTLPVMREQCETCIFRPGNPMRLREGRLAEIVELNRETHTHLVCHQDHKFIAAKEDGRAKEMDRAGIVCRAWYDRYDSQAIQIAERLSLVEFVDGPPEQD